MRHGVKLAVIGAIALSLTGCFNDRDDEQGGGGGRDTATIGNSNPVTRAQENDDGALPLRAVPESGEPLATGRGADDKIVDTRTDVIARGGVPTEKFDVNSATAEQLQTVPGISYVLAQAIVNNRPYRNKQDLIRRIPNLDRRFLDSFDQYLVFGPAGEQGSGGQP